MYTIIITVGKAGSALYMAKGVQAEVLACVAVPTNAS